MSGGPPLGNLRDRLSPHRCPSSMRSFQGRSMSCIRPPGTGRRSPKCSPIWAKCGAPTSPSSSTRSSSSKNGFKGRLSRTVRKGGKPIGEGSGSRGGRRTNDIGYGSLVPGRGKCELPARRARFPGIGFVRRSRSRARATNSTLVNDREIEIPGGFRRECSRSHLGLR